MLFVASLTNTKSKRSTYVYLHVSSRIFYTLFICFVLDNLLESICFRMFCSKHSITFKNRYVISCWFHCVDIFYIKFRFYETFTVIHSVTRMLLIETQYKFVTSKCWFTLCLHMSYKLECLGHLAWLNCVSNSTDSTFSEFHCNN